MFKKRTLYLIIPLLGLLLFCSCQTNYEKLIRGKWNVDVDKSYYINKGQRIYLSDIASQGKAQFQFFDNGIVSFKDEMREENVVRYHLEKDFLYIDGHTLHIVKMNNKRMIYEDERGSDDSEFDHVELTRVDYNAFDMWCINIKCHVPWWIWVLTIAVLVIIGLAEDDNVWAWFFIGFLGIFLFILP